MLETATPARVWVCSTACASGRASWMQPWITKPAWFTPMPTGSSMILPSRSIFTSEDAVISSNIMPNGLIRKWCSGPGTRAEKCVKMRSVHLYCAATW